MLALTRKIDEKIQIGSDICITILHVRGKQVRIGIEAPRQVRVVRARAFRQRRRRQDNFRIGPAGIGDRRWQGETSRFETPANSPPARRSESGRASVHFGFATLGRQTSCPPHAAVGRRRAWPDESSRRYRIRRCGR